MKEQYFAMNLEDPAVPGFVTASKMYVGTVNELQAVCNNMLKDNIYPEYVSALNRLFNGEPCESIPLVSDVMYKKEVICDLNEMRFTHLNTWGFEYDMKFSKAKVSQIIIKHENKYHRCIRAWIFDLFYYSGAADTWRPINGQFWGNYFIMSTEYQSDNCIVNNLLYIVEDSFDRYKDAVATCKDISRISFKGICDEIFADG